MATLVIGGWEVDLVTGACFWDNQLHEMFGANPYFAVSIESMSAFFKGEDRAHFLGALDAAASQGTPFQLDLTLTPAGKPHKWLRIHGNPVWALPGSFRLFGTIQDITTQKAFEHTVPQKVVSHRATKGRNFKAVLPVPDPEGWRANPAGRAYAQRDGDPQERREGLFELVLQHCSDWVCLLDVQGNYHYVDPTVKSLLGYEVDSLIGKNAFSFIHPDDSPGVRSQFESLLPLQRVEIAPYRCQDSQGHWRWIDTTVTNLLADPTVKALVVNSRDATLKSLQEEQLLEGWQQQRILSELQKVMKHSLDVICSIDAEGRFIWLSEACQAMWGYASQELIGRPYIDLVLAEDVSKTRQAAADNMAGVALTNFENRYVCKDGSFRPMAWSAFWLKEEQVMFCVARDATEKKRSEAAMTRIRMAVNHAADAIVITDETGQPIYHNQAFTDLLGYSLEQLRHLRGTGAYFADRDLFNQVSQTVHQGSSWSGDVQCYDIRGNTVDFHLRADAIRDEQGTIIGLIGLWTDIRQRKQAERQLQAQANQIKDILGSITDGFFTLDNHWVFQYLNPEAERRFCRTNQHLLGKNIWEEFKAARSTPFYHHYHRAVATGEAVHFQAYYPPLDAWWEVSAYPSEQGLSVYFRDISQNRLLHSITLMLKEALEMNVSGAFSLAEITDFLLSKVEEMEPKLVCSVLLLDEDGRSLRHLATRSLPPAYAAALDGVAIGPGVGSCGAAVFRGEAVIVPDIATHPNWDDFKHLALPLGLAACWSYPIVSSQKVLGAFAAYAKERRKPSEREQYLIERVVSLLGLLVENKRAEDALRLSNERYQLASRATNDAIWDWDLATNTLHWGSAHTNLFGYDLSGGLDIHTWSDHIHPEDQERILTSLQLVLESVDNDHWQAEYRYLKADHSLAYVYDRGFLLRNAEGKPLRMIGALQDVTERHTAREQLRQSEQLFRSMAENFPNGTIGFLDRDLRFTYAAGREYQSLGIDPAEVIGARYTDAFPAELADYASGLLERTFAGEVMVFDMAYADQHYIVSSVPIANREGVVDKVLLTTQNITQRKRVEAHLLLLESVITHAQDAIVITSDLPLEEPGPRVVYVNDAFTRMCGYTSQEVIGQSPRMLQGPLTDRQELARIKGALQAGQAVDAELVNYTKAGRAYWVSLSIVPVFNQEGTATNFISVERDITQRKQSEAEQKVLVGELVRHNRDLQQFSFITSHNLRAPVANLLGLMSLYKKENPSDPDNGELMAGIEGSVQQLNGTLTDLINVLVIKNNVNIEQESLALAPLFQGVNQSIAQFVRESKARLTVDFSRAPTLVYNRLYLESIFLNMLTNAICYRSPKRPLEIRITSKISGGYLQIDFRDNGLGIDVARYRERLFGLYQRFHEHRESKGLGLYIIKSQITALGGDIEVESEVDKGTTFKVFLKVN